MDNKANIKKAETAEIIKKLLKKNQHSEKATERQLMLSKKCIERNEDLVNDKDETDIEYITYEFNNFKSVYEGFCDTCNVKIQEETINNLTYTKTPEWLALKRSVLKPLNNGFNDDFSFNITVIINGFTLQSYTTQQVFYLIPNIVVFHINHFIFIFKTHIFSTIFKTFYPATHLWQ